VCLPSEGAAGGIIVAWCRDAWLGSGQVCRRFSVSVNLKATNSASAPGTLAVVYGPVDDRLKGDFLDELREVHAQGLGALLLCGDFNLIYQAADKNNDRLNLRAMRRFRRAIDDMAVDELYLHGRLYTWSNERRSPTLERIDRAFATVPWLEMFTTHHLRTLSSDSSDHAPLLLQLCTEPWAKPRFRFEPFWVRLDGYQEVVAQAWECQVPSVDACRLLDIKFRRTARALQSWSMRKVGSVRLQLYMTREIIAQLDKAQESRMLTNDELAWRRDLKCRSLGLASLACTIARHRSRIRYLEEGDANTKFFHLQACHRN